MLEIFGIPNCNTVKKSLDYIKSKNLDYNFHNYKKEGASDHKIQEWLKQQPLEKLINKKGTTYRGLSDADKTALETAETAIPVMISKPSVIKRPIIVKDAKIVALGFDEAQYQEIFG